MRALGTTTTIDLPPRRFCTTHSTPAPATAVAATPHPPKTVPHPNPIRPGLNIAAALRAFGLPTGLRKPV